MSGQMETGFSLMDDTGAAPGEKELTKLPCGGVLTDNSKILLISMGFFSTITVAQVFAAIAANSDALMADCVSMGVDALSYGFNLISEAWPNENKRAQERNQLFGAAVSLSLLLYFTTSFMLEAYDTITHHDDFDSSCCDTGAARIALYGKDFDSSAENWVRQPEAIAKTLFVNGDAQVQAGTWCLDQKQACEKDLACQNAYTMATAAGEPPRDGGDRGETLGKLVECVMDTANCLVAESPGAAANSTVQSGQCYNNTLNMDDDSPAWENEKKCGSPGSCTWTGVDPRIVFAFALFGLLFDAGSLLAFKHFGQKMSLLVGLDVPDPEAGRVNEKAETLNMSSALLHVLSDCLRSTTTLIESILIFMYPATPSYIFDGYATLIVTISIMCGGLYGVFQWVLQLKDWVERGRSESFGAVGLAAERSSAGVQ